MKPGFSRILALLFLSATMAGAQTPTARIAQFDGDRPAAISYTFDDGLRDQYTLAAPMLNEVGFKATFFVIAGKTAATPEEGEQKVENGNVRNLWGGISWPELKKLSEQGHEIASHTWTHPALTKLSPADLEAQIKQAYDAIKEHIGQPPLTIAFPGNGSNSEVQAAALKYHVAFRSFQQSTSGKSTVANLNGWADKLVADKKWGVLMTHGITKGYAAMTSADILRDHFKYVKDHAPDIWVDTFANVARYGKERDDAKLTVTEKPGTTTCLLTSPLDPQLYNVPLTIVVDAPGAKTTHAERAGKELAARLEKGVIYVQAAPAPEPITLTWK